MTITMTCIVKSLHLSILFVSNCFEVLLKNQNEKAGKDFGIKGLLCEPWGASAACL